MEVVEHLVRLGGQILDRQGLMGLYQTIAEHFYPERADFNTTRHLGGEFGNDLMSSYPVMVRRDLGDALSSILRPTNKEWFHQRVGAGLNKSALEADIDHEGLSWLERADGIMRRAMYHPDSGFARGTKEADHDFATFGQAVIQATLNPEANGLLYRCWHLRDVGWMENAAGKIDTVVRKWNPTIYSLSRVFKKGSLHKNIEEKLAKQPFTTTEVWHMVVPADLCQFNKPYRTPYVSIYIDVANKHIIEERPSKRLQYIIPRWRTVQGSQYAVSPATIVALADARLLQAMVGVLLEASEKALNPPIVANKEIFGGNFAAYPGGITYADMPDGDIRNHFQQLPVDKNGIPFGIDRERTVIAQLAEAFYINKLTLPQSGPQMTAYEVGQRVQEYIRQAMPLFEPMEYEYNAPLCDNTFGLLFDAGAFGSPLEMPKSLHGKLTQFTFESPLHDAKERVRGQQFMEIKGMMMEAAELDPSVRHTVDIKKAFRDVVRGTGAPATWSRSESEIQTLVDQEEQARMTQETMAQMQQGADIAKTRSEIQPTAAGPSPFGA